MILCFILAGFALIISVYWYITYINTHPPR